MYKQTIELENDWFKEKNREEYGLMKTDLSKQKIEDKKS